MHSSRWFVVAVVVFLSLGNASAAELVAEREAPRFRGGAMLVGSFALAPWLPFAGVGVAAEAGLVLRDRWSLVARGSLCTDPHSAVTTLGAGVDYALGDSFSAGAGVEWGLALWLPSSERLASSALFPLRFAFFPGGRAEGTVSREGWTFLLQAGPGLTAWAPRLSGPADEPMSQHPLTWSVSLGAGYAWR